MAPNDMRRPLSAEPRSVYEAYFGYSDRLRFVFREPPALRIKRSVPGQTMPGWLCPNCLAVHYDDVRPELGCTSCRGKAEFLLEVFVHKPGRLTSANFRIDHDCPFCGSPSGMGILGARSVTLVSGMIGTIFGSEFNDDPKLLAFSDSSKTLPIVPPCFRRATPRTFSAQDFRGSYVTRSIRIWPTCKRTRLARCTSRKIGSRSRMPISSPPFLPPDMEWRRDYVELLANDALTEGSRLPEYLEERLSWETFAELTFRSRLGATIERAGLAAPHVDMNFIEAATDEFRDGMKDQINVERDIISRADLLRFVAGLLDHMRARGAVINDITRLYVQREAKWYAVGKSYKGGRNSLAELCAWRSKLAFRRTVFSTGSSRLRLMGRAAGMFLGSTSASIRR